MKEFLISTFNRSLAFFKKDLINQTSYRLSFFLNILSIFIAVYVFFIFSKLFEGSNNYLEKFGNNYFFFLIIGISISDVVLRISSVINTEVRNYQLTGMFEEIINLKAPIIELLSYSFIYPIVFSIFRLLIFLLFAVIFFDLPLDFTNIGLIMFAISLTLISCIGIAYIAGAYALAFKKGNPLSAINQLSVMILGGVFFPTTILPDWLNYISQFIPITHALEIIRYLFISDNFLNSEVIKHFYSLALLSFCFLSIGLIVCHFAIKNGKKNGTLTIY